MGTSMQQSSRTAPRRAQRKRFTVLVASDGSPQARAAARLAVDFPWPAHSAGAGLVAWGRELWGDRFASEVVAGAGRVADETKRTLRRRWPAAAVALADASPVEAILGHRPRPDVVVLGAHGYSPLERLMLGSVSRAVVRRSTASVLVVKSPRRPPRHLVIGYDGSANARRAVKMVAGLALPRNARVTLLGLCEVVRPPAIGLMPATIRASLAAEARAFNAKRVAATRRRLERAAKPLAAAGWRVSVDARPGIAVRELVAAGEALRADVMVIGARGASGLRRIFLGSVAETVLDRSAVPVLLVR